MKLKKIASLMLAGVMAVSMLAGCSGKSNDDNNNGQENNGGQATGVSSTFASYLSKDNVKLSDNASNQSILSKAVLDVNDSDIAAIKNIDTVSTNDKALAAVKKVLFVDDLNVTAATGSYQFIKSNVKKPTEYVVMYKAPGDLAQNVVLEQVAAKVDDMFGNLPKNSLAVKNQYDGDELTSGGKYRTFDYTGSVSMADIETKNGEASAWYVMITLTVTPTEVEAPKA